MREYDQEVANWAACWSAARDSGFTTEQAENCEDGQHKCRLCPFQAVRPTHQVLVSYDGCSNWSVTLPASVGGLQQCLDFIGRHLPPKGCEFDLIDLRTGRGISYMVQPAVRRMRLLQQDLRNR